MPWTGATNGSGNYPDFAIFLVISLPLLRYVLLFQAHNPVGALYLTLVRMDSLFVGLAIAIVWDNLANDPP